MELFVDDLVECHGDVRVRAMMVLCSWMGFGSNGCSSIYCDTLSVSQYDSKVRSGFSHRLNWCAQSLNNLLPRLLSLDICLQQCVRRSDLVSVGALFRESAQQEIRLLRRTLAHELFQLLACLVA